LGRFKDKDVKTLSQGDKNLLGNAIKDEMDKK
jgi:hypothetical protein